jgi:hypothetical protein
MVEITARNGSIEYVNPLHVLIVKDSETGDGSDILMDALTKGEPMKVHCKEPAKSIQARISTGLAST